MRKAPLAALLVLFALANCSTHHESQAASAPPPASSTAARPAAESAGNKPTLLFFLNPDGRPCQMQLDLLRASAPIREHATLQLVQTTVAADRNLFYRYGIRALPSLILTDSRGKIVHRFTPGIHPADEILRFLDASG